MKRRSFLGKIAATVAAVVLPSALTGKDSNLATLQGTNQSIQVWQKGDGPWDNLLVVREGKGVTCYVNGVKTTEGDFYKEFETFPRLTSDELHRTKDIYGFGQQESICPWKIRGQERPIQ